MNPIHSRQSSFRRQKKDCKRERYAWYQWTSSVLQSTSSAVILIPICLVCTCIYYPSYSITFHTTHSNHTPSLSNILFTHIPSIHTPCKFTYPPSALLHPHTFPLSSHPKPLHLHTQTPSIFTSPCSPSTLYIFKPKTARLVRAPLRRGTTAGTLTAFRSWVQPLTIESFLGEGERGEGGGTGQDAQDGNWGREGREKEERVRERRWYNMSAKLQCYTVAAVPVPLICMPMHWAIYNSFSWM